MNKKNWYKKGLRDGVPICLGYFAVSFAFGIQAAELPLSPLEAGILSLTNLTSAGQFAGLSVIASAGSLLEMALVQLVINLRYLLMSTALSQKLDEKTGLGPRLLIAYGVTDEIFGVSITSEGKLSPFYSCGLITVSAAGWTGGTVLGAAAGAILPGRVISALGIALYGMFLAIILPPARKDRALLWVILAAAGLSTLFYFLPALKGLDSGMTIILITVAVAAFAAILHPVEEMT